MIAGIASTGRTGIAVIAGIAAAAAMVTSPVVPAAATGIVAVGTGNAGEGIIAVRAARTIIFYTCHRKFSFLWEAPASRGTVHSMKRQRRGFPWTQKSLPR